MKKSRILQRTILFSFLFLLLIVSVLTARAAGETDPAFNTAIQNNIQGSVFTIVPQPDGKVFVGGNFTVAGNSARSNVARFNADGTVDQTFAPPDFSKYLLGAESRRMVNIFAIARQSDGKILVGGNFSSIADQARTSLVRLNADGSLDNSFNIVFEVTPNIEDVYPKIYEIKVQSDNKIIVGGYFRTSAGAARRNIARLNTDGTVDTTFADQNAVSDVRAIEIQPDGKIIYSVYSTSGVNAVLRRVNTDGSMDNSFLTSNFLVNSIVLQPDGKILVGGSFLTSSSQQNIARLNTNGAIDPNFNVGGAGADGIVKDVALLSDGRIIIGGDFIRYNAALRIKNARLNTDGTLDSSFNYPTGNAISVYAVAASSDGGFFFGGNGTLTNGQPWDKFVRFNASGSLDSTFQGGIYQTGIVYQVAAQPDGRILAGGSFQKVNGIARQNIVRLNADGDVDRTFNASVTGKVATLALQSDGKILIAGDFTQVNGTARLSVARLNADGTLDTDFSTALVNISIIEKMLALPDGKILIAGYFRLSNYNFILNIARLNANGSTDTSFSQMPVNTPGFAHTVKLQADGKIVIGGGFTQIAGANRNKIARLNADGTIDETFDPIGADADIYDLAVQSNGRIVIGGEFLSVSNVSAKYRLARLLPNGALDTSFNPSFNAPVYAVERQADDKILVGGGFTPFPGGIERTRIARLQADGTIDNTFAGTGANDTVRNISIQADGKILIGGEFSRVNGASRASVARLLNATSSIKTPFDFDGDGRADVSVFRSSNGTWYTSTNPAINYGAIQFGIANDKLVPADYDGDGKTDVAVYRSGTWYLNRTTAGFTSVAFGTAEDIPVPADYDGDGKADVAVFRPSNGTWYLLQSTGGFKSIAFGLGTDKPVPADYDGDGKADVAVFRPSNGTWYTSTNPAINYGAVNFGTAEDKPVPADYDGDGKTDIAVFRPSNGTWYLNRSTAGFAGIQFGSGSDLPTAADYDGDGKADVAVFRGGTWYLNRSTAGFTSVAFGVSGDAPVPNAFVR